MLVCCVVEGGSVHVVLGWTVRGSAWGRDILGRQINVGAVKNQVRMSDTWGSCGLILSGDATERVKGHMRPIHLWLSYIAFRQ